MLSMNKTITFFLKKTNSISIRADVLEQVDEVNIHVAHRNVVISATKNEIKAYKDVKTFYGETKYYYPIKNWFIISGDSNWVEGLLS